MREGLGAGHQAHFYEAVGQRFLGDERFLADLQRKATARHEVMVKRPPVSFDQVLQAVARVTSFSPDQLMQAGRQRDPSLISRLYARYMAERRPRWERKVLAMVERKVNTHA